MKILQINAVYGIGSTGRIARDISDALISNGHQSHVMWAISCNTRPGTEEPDLIRIGNIFDHKLHALLSRLDGGQGMHSKAATKRACKKILEISPDVVHLHNLHSNYIHLPTLFEFLTKHNIPTLVTLHDCWFLSAYCTNYKNYNNCHEWLNGCKNCPAVNKRLKKAVEKNYSLRKKIYSETKHLAVNGVSKWTADAAKKSILNRASHIEYIYNWIDTDVFTPRNNVSEIKQKYGISDERKMILGVSQLWCKDKGLDSFVMLAEELADVADIILVGGSEELPEMKNLRCIGFTSNVNELIDLYSAADVLINASNVETFGLVTIEAMACGTPVVAYNNSGSSELVNDKCGILVEDGNKKALLRGVKEVLDKDKSDFSLACRQYVCENFNKEDQIQKYINYYQKISLSAQSCKEQ